MKKDDWLEKRIEEQRGQRKILEEVSSPFSPEELCEEVREEDE